VLAKTFAVQEYMQQLPQVDIETIHTIHAGIYTRTICVPAGVTITGALMKIPTTLIVNGDCLVTIGDKTAHVAGHHVLCASAGRKQIFVAISDTWLTMMFHTHAKTVGESEREFTDEYELLRSNECKNVVTITEA
jgi:hypothetical protein